MVMMDKTEKPSPNQVGREFVRQYYTLLNKAPELLHRFYSVSSSYVHGGKYCNGEPEKPVIGQADIHRKISSLKFHDCHTKIRQVDAHSTVGNGVVIQVTGELSNCGQALRPFMQTFVLAPQGENPFKFYVHNDIFRYQDEVFHDSTQNEQSEEEEPELVDELDQQLVVATDQPPEFEENFYKQPVSDEVTEEQPSMLTNGIEQRDVEEPAMDERQDTPSPVVEEVAAETPSPAQSPIPETEDVAPPADTDAIEEEFKEMAIEDKPLESKSSKPFSWADLASKNTPAARAPAQQGVVVKVNRSPKEQVETVDAGDVAPRQPRNPKFNQRFPPRDDDRRDDRQERRGFGPGSGSGIRFPDNQQIFVGNLPYNITEEDLREHFQDFGRVLEVRISNSHTSNPNYGFVIFEDPKAVEDVLQVMPTHYKDSHRINIEEKKQRSLRDGPRRGDPRRGGMGDGGRGGRRMPLGRRDRQGSREGPRPNYNNASRR